MNSEMRERRINFRAVIETFIKSRLNAKLDKLAEDDPKFQELMAQHDPAIWLADAARRVGQIQAVTHTLKPIHPDARGTNLYRRPDSLPACDEIGSHVISPDFVEDIVGNAAALDVYKLLKVDLEGESLLRRLLANEPDAIAALDPDAEKAAALAQAFCGLVRKSEKTPSSHTRAKQLYWLDGDNPLKDEHYTLLAPLHASSLAHAIYRMIQHDRFSDEAIAANKAYKEGVEHANPRRRYGGLVVQKLGGTKPQNISQLNSERGGNNYLLSSRPPTWTQQNIVPPLHADSVFPRRFGMLPDVRDQVRDLRDFLLDHPPANMATRNRRETYVDELIGELVAYASAIHGGMPDGWSRHPDCRLVHAEQLWLDPGRAQLEGEEAFDEAWQRMNWPDEIGRRFGNWLNEALGPDLPLGDVEQRQWRNELLLDEGEDGFAWSVHQDRQRLEIPSPGPLRRKRP